MQARKLRKGDTFTADGKTFTAKEVESNLYETRIITTDGDRLKMPAIKQVKKE